MNILVTGSEGFIGRNLVERLRKEGHFVVGYDVKKVSRAISGIYFKEVLSSILIKAYDLVVHLGANSSTTETDLNKILRQNFEVSKDLFEACQRSGTRFQYASSASVYGTDSEHFSEDEFCKPLSPYAFSKYMFDCWIGLQSYPYQGFRYFNVYGNGEEDKGDQASPIFKFAKQARETGVIKLFHGSRNSYRDFVCVDDICEMHLKFINAPNVSGVFNIGPCDPISFLEVAEAVKKKISSKLEYIPFPEHLIDQYQEYTCADLTKLEEAIGEYKWTSVEEWIEKNIT